MKPLRKINYLMFLFILLLSFNSFGQDVKQKDSINLRLTNAARDIMSKAGTCALITLDEKGLPMVRTMDPFLPESDFIIWFGTNSKSRKVKQIKNNPTVTIYYLEKGNTGYVVLHGVAQLIDDQDEKEKHWKAEWEAFYPDKKENYLLIKVTPQWMKVLSITQGIMGDPITWETPIVYFD